MASAGGRLRHGRGRNILFFYSLPHGLDHVSLCVWSPLWLADAGHVTGCGSAIGWRSHDLLPDPGLAQPVSHVRGEAAVGQTLLGLGISQLTSWLKFLDTRASNEGSRRFHNHRECPYAINSLLPVSRYIDTALAEKGSHKKKLTTKIFGHI